ncbi:putative DNA-binding domain-containing protein [Pseudobacteriovorax antillogorgiicola]|uniref:Putative DNA-binding domain-containing protein n=1 Tax=Pseudobacteriovorax antillogorgiicola TaxID=1513793 RepID=A0A1Y6CC60_9BACT|nr:putative DNA-binding domain-containing protein [Pseudobacteriovorax antillogorgiicola]TCS49364.1 putative DNA-binding protein [Pseudobacteriovorax antillogorgiicola]SMF47501.1 Putative DNA-binding domain-containing protein [Pseudobacteriovorax antillogorgiicola]
MFSLDDSLKQLKRQQEALVAAIQSDPSEPNHVIEQGLKDAGISLTSQPHRLDIYRSDYYARLVSVAKEGILAPLVRVVEGDELWLLLRDYLIQYPCENSQLDYVYDNFPNYIRSLGENSGLSQLADWVSVTIRYWHLTWALNGHDTRPLYRNQEDLDHVFLRSGCALLEAGHPLPWAKLFGVSDQETCLGLAFARVKDQPGVLPLSIEFNDFAESLLQRASVQVALETLEDQKCSADEVTRVLSAMVSHNLIVESP